MSESDIFKNIWPPIIGIVFEGLPIIITCGEAWVSSSKGITTGQDERVPYKVDLRLIMGSSSPDSPSKIQSYSLASCEVSKNEQVRKTTNDNKKLMVEGKIILDSITKKCSLSFKTASKLKIVSLQLSDLKGMLVQLKYAKDQHECVTQTIGQIIVFPTAAKYFESLFAISLPNLLYCEGIYNLSSDHIFILSLCYLYEQAENNLKILQEGLNEDISDFGVSNHSEYNPSFTKPTWLGPKTMKSKVIALLADLTF